LNAEQTELSVYPEVLPKYGKIESNIVKVPVTEFIGRTMHKTQTKK
jgi:hypothetical protein